MTVPETGLCGHCRHARIVRSRRGSIFWFCERSKTDARFARYPTLPVLACAGYEDGAPTDGAAGAP